MKRKLHKFREYHLEKLKNPKAAKVYLEVALEEFEKDKDKETFLKALRDVAEARGGLCLQPVRGEVFNRRNCQKAGEGCGHRGQTS